MSTENLKTTQGLIEDIVSRNKGPFGISAFIVSLSIIVVNLPDGYVNKLIGRWIIIAAPSIIVLLGGMGQAYLIEQRNRTKIEEKIYGKLDTLAQHFERMFEGQLDNKLYLDKSFDKVADEHREMVERVDRVFRILEKRSDILHAHSGDTEKFIKR